MSEERPVRIVRHQTTLQADLPDYILPMRVAAPRAAALGYRAEPIIGSIFVINARVDAERSLLVAEGLSTIVAIAAEHGRVLSSLSPPVMSNIDLEAARSGLATIRFPRIGWFARGVRLARRPAGARPFPNGARAREIAEKWLAELEAAWRGGVRSLALVGWPAYPARDPRARTLDAVDGNLMPPAASIFTSSARGEE